MLFFLVARQQIQRWTLLSAPECHIRVRRRLSWDSLSEFNWPVFSTAGTAMNRKWGNKEFGSSCKVTRDIFKYQNVSHVLESLYSVGRVALVTSVVLSLLEYKTTSHALHQQRVVVLDISFQTFFYYLGLSPVILWRYKDQLICLSCDGMSSIDRIHVHFCVFIISFWKSCISPQDSSISTTLMTLWFYYFTASVYII